jgi:formylglycine-generating enzyme
MSLRHGGRCLPGVLGLLVWCGVAGCGPTQPEPVTGKGTDAPAKTVTCPDGQVLKGDACVAAAPTTCPEGQVLKDGGCVAAPQATASATASPDQAPTAQASAAPEAPKGPCPVGMALVKGGTYKLGLLRYEATIGDLCHDITEATAKEYEQCVGQKKCNENLVKGCPETSTYKVAGREDHPMVCIDFTQAIDYCAAQGKRLPTEEEWEWAARGGAEGRQYSWGNDAPGEQACWSGGKNPLTGTCPVKAHPGTATPQGLLGMSGNVFEWVSRKLDVKVKGRAGRGGSWRDGLANVLRVDRPGMFEVTYRCGFLGVRCVVAPKAP